MYGLTERIVTPFAVFNFLGGGTESSFSVLLCLILPDDVGMLRLQVMDQDSKLGLKHADATRDAISKYT